MLGSLPYSTVQVPKTINKAIFSSPKSSKDYKPRLQLSHPISNKYRNFFKHPSNIHKSTCNSQPPPSLLFCLSWPWPLQPRLQQKLLQPTTSRHDPSRNEARLAQSKLTDWSTVHALALLALPMESISRETRSSWVAIPEKTPQWLMAMRESIPSYYSWYTW